MQATMYRLMYICTIQTNHELNVLVLGSLTLTQSTIPLKEMLL